MTKSGADKYTSEGLEAERQVRLVGLSFALVRLRDKTELTSDEAEEIVGCLKELLCSEETDGFDWDDAYDSICLFEPVHFEAIPYLIEILYDPTLISEEQKFAKNWARKAIWRINR